MIKKIIGSLFSVFVLVALFSFCNTEEITKNKIVENDINIPESNVAPQMKQYVTWTYSQKKISADEYELIFKAKIEPTWHLYSQIESVGETVPLPTIFEFDKSKDYKLIGKTSEPKPIEHAEPVFDNAVMRYFENTATFKQKIKALTDKPFVVKGIIDGMACNETQCQKFSPTPEFSFKIEGAEIAVNTETSTAETNTTTVDTSAVAEVTAPSNTITPINETKLSQLEPKDPTQDKVIGDYLLQDF